MEIRKHSLDQSTSTPAAIHPTQDASLVDAAYTSVVPNAFARSSTSGSTMYLRSSRACHESIRLATLKLSSQDDQKYSLAKQGPDETERPLPKQRLSYSRVHGLRPYFHQSAAATFHSQHINDSLTIPSRTKQALRGGPVRETTQEYKQRTRGTMSPNQS